MKRMMKRCFALLAVLAVSSLLGTSVFAQGATYGPFCYGETVVLDHAANPNIPIFYDPNTRQPVVPEITFGGTDFVLDHSTNRYKKEIFEYLLDKDATAPFYFRITWYLEPTTKDIVVCNSSTGTIIVCGDSEGEITVNEETKQLTWRGLTIDATKSGSYPLKAAAGPTGVETECTIATLNVRSITPTYFKDTAITICRRDAEEAMNWFDQFHWSWYETGPNGEQIKHDETTEYQQGLEREATHTYSLKSRVCPECDSIIGNVTITKIIKAPMIQRHYWISYDEDKFYFPSNGQYYDYKYDPVYPNNATEEMVEIYYTGKDGVECPDSSFFLYIHRHKEPVTDTKDTFMCKDGPGFVWKPNEQNDYTETIPGDKEGTYRCTIPTFDDMCDSLIYILNTHIIEKRAGQQILYHTACTPNNTYEYTWPDGVTQTFTFNTALDYEFEHTIKSKRCPVCDSVDCLLKLHYSPGGHREPYITKLYICYDSTSVAFPPMQRSYTEGTHYPQYIFSDGRRGGEEEKDAWGVCHDSVFWLEVSKITDPIIPYDGGTVDLCRNDYPDGYEWQNKKITEDGTYYDTLKYDYCNCDKARYQITVKFHEPSDSTFNVYMCHNTSYTWPVNNTTYTTDIEGLVVTLAKANAAGCDSVCTLNLHFLPETEHKNLDTFFCDDGSVNVFGEEINYPISKENRHEIHIPSSFNPNCDSIIYHVAVERRESSHPDPVYDTICYTDLPYVWNGIEYFEGGTLEQTLTNMGGCDSFCVIKLFVTPKPDTIKVDSMVCVGKKFDWRDKVIDFIDEPFTYEKHYQFTQYGEQVKCDSVVFMLDADTMDCCTHLTNYKLIKPEITNQLYVCPDETSPYTMTLGYSAGLPASYTLTFDSKAIQKGFENGAQIFDDSNSPSSEYILVPVPFPSTPSVNYLRPDAYTFEIVVIDSCERPFTHILRDTIFVYYPSWITEQYLNSTFALLNDKYNKGYTFSSMQWYADGAAIGGATQSYITVHTTPLDSVAYQMYLVRSDDKYGTFTCPVYLSENTRTTPVTEGFVTVIPTKIDKTNPLVYITSNKRGTYTIYDAFGRLVQRENFANCGNGCTISIPTAPQHLLLMIVELEDGYSETFFLLVQ